MTETLSAIEQSDAFALGVCQIDRQRMLDFIKRLSVALYSSDFTEPLGQYMTESFYNEAKTLIQNCERSIAESAPNMFPLASDEGRAEAAQNAQNYRETFKPFA